MEYLETAAQGDGPSYTDLHGLHGPQQYDEMQRLLWMDGAAALAKANATLAHENMFLRAMQENARLAHENKMLREANVYRMQALAPPGLLQDPAPGWPGVPPASPSFPKGGEKQSSRQGPGGWMIHDCKGRKSAYLGRLNNSRSSDVSTAAGSSHRGSMQMSPAATQRGSVQMSAAGSSQRGSVQMSAAASSQRGSLQMSPATSSQRGSLQMSAAASSQIDSVRLSAIGSSHEGMPSSDNDHHELDVDHQGPVTSAMMRNLPNDYTRSMLLDLLRSEGFGGTFDFVYLPHDFRSCSGLGYAFVNFNSLDSARQFREDFTGFNRWAVASDKVCEVTWSSLQGLEAHIERYRNSPVMHESIPEEQKPALFKGVDTVPFPPPTKKIRLPRHWHRRR